MESHLERNVHRVMAEFPGVSAVLSRHAIGCSTCDVGSCRLRDVFEVHGLSEPQQREIMREIAAVIFPGQEVELPRIERRKTIPPRPAAGFSPALQQLVDEHRLIGRMLALVPWIARRLDEDPGRGLEAARDIVQLIRSCVEEFHHAKEEEILFAFFDPEMDTVKSMRSGHDAARALGREISTAIEANDAGRVAAHLAAYRDLLVDQAGREEEIHYPLLQSRLTVRQVGEMFARFAAFGSRLHDGVLEQEGRLRKWEQTAARHE